MATLRVNGEDVDIPDVDSLTMDEAIVLYSYSSLTLDQLDEVEGLHPGVLGGLVHVAVARLHPEMKAKEIEQAVRKLNLLELIASVSDQEAEVVEPDLTTEPEPSSDAADEPSGNGSSPNSEPSPASKSPSATGMHESASSVSSQAREYTELGV